MTVKYPRYHIRDKVFPEKGKFKGSGKSITKTFTTKGFGQLNDANKKHGFSHVSSNDGKVFHKI